MYPLTSSKRGTDGTPTEPDGIFGWLLSDLNHLVGAVALVLLVGLLMDALIYGRPNRARCGAPTKKNGRCRNPAPRPGGVCAAGHGSAWVLLEMIGAVVLLGVGIYALLATPFPESLAEVLRVSGHEDP